MGSRNDLLTNRRNLLAVYLGRDQRRRTRGVAIRRLASCLAGLLLKSFLRLSGECRLQPQLCLAGMVASITATGEHPCDLRTLDDGRRCMLHSGHHLLGLERTLEVLTCSLAYHGDVRHGQSLLRDFSVAQARARSLASHNASMFMLRFKACFDQELLPFVSRLMRRELHLAPLRTTDLEVRVAVMFEFLELTAERAIECEVLS